MEKIDTTQENTRNVMNENNESTDAILLREIINKLNEIIDWINEQWLIYYIYQNPLDLT